MKEITQQNIRNCKIKIQKHGVKLTENNTTYNTDDDDETVEHRTHTSINKSYLYINTLHSCTICTVCSAQTSLCCPHEFTGIKSMHQYAICDIAEALPPPVG
jgi:hypothetical protein